MTKETHPNAYNPSQAEIDKAARAIEAGVTEVTVAKMLGIDYKTYQKAVKPHVDDSIGEIKQFAVGKLFQLIKRGEPSAIFFFLKTRCGWRENDKKIERAIEDLRNVLVPTISMDEWKQEVMKQHRAAKATEEAPERRKARKK